MRRSLKASVLGMALMGSVFGLASGAQAYSVIGSGYSGYGHDTGGPGYLINIGAGGTLTITATGQSTNYDGSDDSYIGVQNTSGSTVNSITLTDNAAFNNDIFGFDGDGIDTYGAPGNGMDKTGYGGPDSYFSNINLAQTSGTVNFIGGLQTGQQTYFSLEEDLGAAVGSGSIGGGVGTVPLPASFPMFGGALVALGVVAYGAKRRKAGAAAV